MKRLLSPSFVGKRLVVYAAFLLLGTSSAWAQVDRATITGVVQDPNGARISGAKATLTSERTGLTRETVTNESGAFVLSQLPVGVYDLKVSQAGFATAKFNAIELGPGETRSLSVALQVGVVDNVVNVEDTASAPIDSASFTVGTVIKNEQVQNLPLNGRHWASLMTLAPGAVNTGSGSQNTVRFNGRGRDENNFTLDGMDQTGVKDPRQEENLRLVVSTEAIAEFRINTAIYSADQGNGAGAQVNLVSRTGTNDLHGSVFHFLRNSALDARLFTDADSQKDLFQLNQFGARVGGPIVKDRTFFFGSYEGLRQRRGVSFVNLVPSASFRQSLLSGPNATALRPILDLYPLGAASVNATTDSVTIPVKNTLNEDSFSFRLDHRFTQNQSLFFRAVIDDANAVLYNREDSINTRSFQFQPANYLLQYQTILTPNFVNETRFGVNRSPLDRVDGNGRLVEGPRIDGYTRLRPTVNQAEKGTSFSFINNSSWVNGRHTIRFGGEARRIRVNVGESQVLELRFRSPADFLANRVDSFDLNGEQGTLGERRWYYMPFVQDDFRIRPNLTFNLGLRYEYYSVAKEVKDRGRVFDLACGGFCAPGTPWYAPDRNNFAPRIGFAWSPERFKRKTAIRGGFGIFFGPGQNDDVNAAIDNARDRFSLARSATINLVYPITPFVGQGGLAPFSPRALARDREDFYSQNWSLSIVQELPLKLTGVIGYVGNSAHHLFSRNAINVINPATGTRPVTAQGTLRFGEGDIKENRGNSNFHALQMSLYRRLGRGLTLGTEYMWSHAISDFPGSGESDQPQNVFDLRSERGNTEFDIRHSFTSNFVWELPFGRGRRWLTDGGAAAALGGWQLSGIAVARTGRPVNVTISRSASLLPDQNSRSIQRPNLVAGADVAGNRNGNAGFLNPAAFSAPARNVYGNAPRNAGRGPALVQFDTSISKTFAVSERHRFDFRMDVFNLFNRSQYGQPDGFLGTVTYNAQGVPTLTPNPNFGTSLFPLSVDVGTGTNRSLQFSLRYNF